MLAAITKWSMMIIWIIITPNAPEERSRKSKPPINLWVKSLLKFLVCWWAIFDNFVSGLKVRRRPHSGYPLGYNHQCRAPRKCPKILSSLTTPPQAIEDSIPRLARFDSDSKQITVDTGATLSLSHDRNDFVGNMTPLTRNVRGVSGNVNATHIGTVVWQIEDDNGQVHSIHISNVMYIPTASSRLLSPQHWAQESNDLAGTGCDTNGKRVKLYWNNGQYVKTIPLNPGTNVGSMMTAPGVQMFHAYAAQYQFHPSELNCFPVHVIPDDEESLQPPDPIAPPQENNFSPIQDIVQSPEDVGTNNEDSIVTTSSKQSVASPVGIPQGPAINPIGHYDQKAQRSYADVVRNNRSTHSIELIK